MWVCKKIWSTIGIFLLLRTSGRISVYAKHLDFRNLLCEFLKSAYFAHTVTVPDGQSPGTHSYGCSLYLVRHDSFLWVYSYVVRHEFLHGRAFMCDMTHVYSCSCMTHVYSCSCCLLSWKPDQQCRQKDILFYLQSSISVLQCVADSATHCNISHSICSQASVCCSVLQTLQHTATYLILFAVLNGLLAQLATAVTLMCALSVCD